MSACGFIFFFSLATLFVVRSFDMFMCVCLSFQSDVYYLVALLTKQPKEHIVTTLMPNTANERQKRPKYCAFCAMKRQRNLLNMDFKTNNHRIKLSQLTKWMEDPEWKGMKFFLFLGWWLIVMVVLQNANLILISVKIISAIPLHPPARWYQLMIEMNDEIWSLLKFLRTHTNTHTNADDSVLICFSFSHSIRKLHFITVSKLFHCNFVFSVCANWEQKRKFSLMNTCYGCIAFYFLFAFQWWYWILLNFTLVQ